MTPLDGGIFGTSLLSNCASSSMALVEVEGHELWGRTTFIIRESTQYRSSSQQGRQVLPIVPPTYRSDDNVETLRIGERLETFHKQTGPVAEYYNAMGL
ncbi:uncharacterized protein EDB91DRAFT_1249834 [Suillus paluster]|uniref:uncharacterized protein n=1 Tax=Suillus paluster TaxID=48578 RepID=UPI001B87CAD1|nr:uncharacterized protein EDB91DRAFT_1249834 [Suillus paluster]KAG1736864.1 hypothetical protein EDB91DRAFT_1249834 [Suillus paluster]